jgi:hypothetical protein
MDMSIKMLEAVEACEARVRATVPQATELPELVLAAIIIAAIRSFGEHREKSNSDGFVVHDFTGRVPPAEACLAAVERSVRVAVTTIAAGEQHPDAVPILHPAVGRFMSLAFAAKTKRRLTSYNSFVQTYLPLLRRMDAVRCSIVYGVPVWEFTDTRFAHLYPEELMSTPSRPPLKPPSAEHCRVQCVAEHDGVPTCQPERVTLNKS